MMSDRLAIASAFSVLAMASFVLFGADIERAPLAGESGISPMDVTLSAELPRPRDVIELIR